MSATEDRKDVRDRRDKSNKIVEKCEDGRDAQERTYFLFTQQSSVVYSTAVVLVKEPVYPPLIKLETPSVLSRELDQKKMELE